MPTEKNPRAGSDETAPLPVTPADDTVVLPPANAAPAPDVSAETVVVPLDDATSSPADTAVLPLDADSAVVGDTAVLPVDETRAVPTAEPVAEPATTPLEATQAPYASPIGALYAPTDRSEEPGAVRTSAYAEPAGATAYAEPVGAGYPVDRDDPVAAPADPTPVVPARRRLRVGTVVWGLVIAAIGVGLLAWAAGVAIDLQLAMIVLLAVAGTALLVGSIVSGARNARR